ncbi:neuronal acetylcholine receptor subunit alpha-3-like isoform X2 [Mya arenaria]|uniref:neuronal acetylcholine receptor subunit alpha-3-like isoform X2 n=1 Tax=Mya arenaria TaxID=6604 RepID=UPI0022E702C1|nr:neuronal acetylcholine receptor subunit alpha-3-like isoform X2 [Mya arenaria]
MKGAPFGIFCAFLLVTNCAPVEGVYSAAQETAIRTAKLDTNYDPVSRPADTTEVKIGLNVLAIDELDLKSQKLTLAGWLTMEWEDSRLAYTKASYDDIESAFAQPSKIWKPEVVIDNSLEDLGVVTDSSLLLRFDYLGLVEWEPPRAFNVHCEVDITYYPYDVQGCSLKIVGWGYTASEVNLVLPSTPINLEDFETHGEWVVLRSEATTSSIVEILDSGATRTFPVLEYKLIIRRRTDFYNLNVMMPVIVTSLLVALTFIVPFESGEKLSYVLTVFLALAVLLTITSDALPPTSITVSVLGLYLGVITVLAAVGILLTVLLQLMYHTEGRPKLTGVHGCVLAVTRFAARVVCSTKQELLTSRVRTQKVVPLSQTDLKKASPAKNDEETMSLGRDTDLADISWSEIAIIWDRFLFVIFMAVTVIMNISFIIALVAGGNSDQAA